MPIGEKAFEERNKKDMPFIYPANTNDRTLVSYSSEVEGFRRWPSGTIIGSGVERIGADGIRKGRWDGLWLTKEGDFIYWKGAEWSTEPEKNDKMVMLMHFQTTAEKLQWMNRITVVAERARIAHRFAGIAYELK